MAMRYPLALSEMRWPSVPLNTFDTRPLARWGIEVQAGPLRVRLAGRATPGMESAIAEVFGGEPEADE